MDHCRSDGAATVQTDIFVLAQLRMLLLYRCGDTHGSRSLEIKFKRPYTSCTYILSTHPFGLDYINEKNPMDLLYELDPEINLQCSDKQQYTRFASYIIGPAQNLKFHNNVLAGIPKFLAISCFFFSPFSKILSKFTFSASDNVTNMNMILEAAGDGPVNGMSMPINRVLRVRILVHGNGAGDPGISMTVNRVRTTTPLLMIDTGRAAI
ncbi:hypothetical protein QTP88_025830 [Uroleucon formosanum]